MRRPRPIRLQLDVELDPSRDDQWRYRIRVGRDGFLMPTYAAGRASPEFVLERVKEALLEAQTGRSV